MRETAEIYFFDGLMRGTYKFVDLNTLLSNRVYRAAVPIQSTLKPIENSTRVIVQAYEITYLIVPLPVFYGEKRFVLVEEPRS
jgi:hypothetical protein